MYPNFWLVMYLNGEFPESRKRFLRRRWPCRHPDSIFQSSLDSDRVWEIRGKEIERTRVRREWRLQKEIFVVENRKCRRWKSDHVADSWRCVWKDKNDLPSTRVVSEWCIRLRLMNYLMTSAVDQFTSRWSWKIYLHSKQKLL